MSSAVGNLRGETPQQVRSLVSLLPVYVPAPAETLRPELLTSSPLRTFANISASVPPAVTAGHPVHGLQLPRVRETSNTRCFPGEQECRGREEGSGARAARVEGATNHEGEMMPHQDSLWEVAEC